MGGLRFSQAEIVLMDGTELVLMLGNTGLTTEHFSNQNSTDYNRTSISPEGFTETEMKDSGNDRAVR